jgi:hypothetical protein
MVVAPSGSDSVTTRTAPASRPRPAASFCRPCHEVEWKACDLTGRDLIIEGAFQRKALPGALTFIRAVPLARLPAVVPRPDVWRPMCISNDGCGVFEISAYQPDGACLCMVRGVPLVLYEPIVVNDFQKVHGVDPRSLTSTDERWLEYQAGIITAFIREVRAGLAPEQKLSIMVSGNEGDCRSWGFDVKTWAAERIVDDLYPVGQTFNEANVHECNPRWLDFQFFQGLPRRHRMRLIPTFTHGP